MAVQKIFYKGIDDQIVIQGFGINPKTKVEVYSSSEDYKSKNPDWDIVPEPYLSMGYNVLIVDINPNDFSDLTHVDQLYIENAELKKDLNWSKKLMPHNLLAQKLIKSEKNKILSAKNSEEHFIAIANLEKCKFMAKEFNNDLYFELAKNGLDTRVSEGELDKPEIRSKLESKPVVITAKDILTNLKLSPEQRPAKIFKIDPVVDGAFQQSAVVKDVIAIGTPEFNPKEMSVLDNSNMKPLGSDKLVLKRED